MARQSVGHRSPFEVDNARNEDSADLVTTYVLTESFWRLLSAKNHIVLGARGSGKTALVKMLAHETLSQVTDRRIRGIIEKKELIGIYVPTKLEWVSCLKNKPWKTDAEIEAAFQWRLNVSTCAAFLITLKSCLKCYIEDHAIRARLELSIISKLSEAWVDPGCKEVFSSISDLEEYLRDREYKKQQSETFARAFKGEVSLPPVGLCFDQELFSPLRRAIDITSKALQFPNSSKWILCIDEAEFLDEIHHRIINSHIRAHPGRLFFKITTTPYFHHTLSTNTKTPLSVGHDFEYVYIDQYKVDSLPKGERVEEYFAKSVINRRAEHFRYGFNWHSLELLLGSSQLLDQKPSDWALHSNMFQLLEKHANKITVARAKRLLGTGEFKDQISRKMQGALLLKEAVANQRGNIELAIYDGLSMAIKCCESNPRRLIRVVNSFLLEADFSPDRKTFKKLSSNRQTSVLRQFSASTLNRVQTEERIGRGLFLMLESIGNTMSKAFHDNQLSTDQYTSIKIDNTITEDRWELIKHAVSQGLLVPNVNTNQLDQMPFKTGTFHLSYILAPHFKLLPRRGKSVSFTRALTGKVNINEIATHGIRQLSIFGD